MTIGIAIDGWKLPIFDRHLSQAGYEFEKHDGATDETLLLKVKISEKSSSLSELKNVVQAANDEACFGRN